MQFDIKKKGLNVFTDLTNYWKKAKYAVVTAVAPRTAYPDVYTPFMLSAILIFSEKIDG